MNRIRMIVFLLPTIYLLSCTQTSLQLETGTWRAVAELPGGELPFSIDVEQRGDTTLAWLINGEERVLVPEVQVSGSVVTLALPSFGSTISGEVVSQSDGVISEFRGTLTLTKRGGVKQVMPLTATAGSSERFATDEQSEPIRVQGKWAVTFREEDGSTTEAIAIFHQSETKVTGTFLTPTGDYRFLAGSVAGRKLSLSCFDGAHAFLFVATMSHDEILRGDFWSGTRWHETWTAILDDNAELPDAYQLTYLKEGYDKIAFSFPNLDSTIISLEDDAYQGKVVMLQIAGSWCPNCHDETAFLSPFYKKYRDQGLEIIGLMYEHFPEFHDAAKQVRRYRKRYDVEYETLIAGYSSKTDAAATLPMLNHVLSYPTTIFIDKSGAVRKIHTGFTGPGTGEYYERVTGEFTSFVEQLLAEG